MTLNKSNCKYHETNKNTLNEIHTRRIKSQYQSSPWDTSKGLEKRRIEKEKSWDGTSQVEKGGEIWDLRQWDWIILETWDEPQ